VGARHLAAQSSRKRWVGLGLERLGLERSDGRKSGGRRVITIALSLLSTSVVTSGLGFVFWAIAAHMTTTEVVGRAAAVISAMQLIATFCTLGLHTLLIVELPGHAGAGLRRLIVTSVGIVGCAAFACAAGYAVIYDIAARTSEWIYATPIGIALFGVGAAVTTGALVLDAALLGVQRSGQQVSRNLVFSLTKLIALPVAAVAIGLSPQVVFSVWLLGNLISLLILAMRTETAYEWLKTIPSLRGFYPLWRTAAGHHWINVATQTPRLVLPIMVATQLSHQANAGFYAALLLVSFVWFIPYHLAVGTFALDSEHPEEFGHGLNTALRLSGVVSILAAAGAPIFARPLLAIFGPGYEQARYCLIVLAICTFASAIKSIYIAVRRAQGALGKAATATALGGALELIAAQVGLKSGGVTGIGIALGTAMVVEAAFYWPHIRKARRRFDQQDTELENNHSAEERDISNADDRAWETIEVGRVSIHSAALVQVANANHDDARLKSQVAPGATQSNGFSQSNAGRKHPRSLTSEHTPILGEEP
jgi:O-antigen/teichoic acid export membrane protein